MADAGTSRIEWADGQMPVLRSIRARFERERPLEGLRVGACLHLTAETANLVRALLAGGAQVAVCPANPLSTQDEVVEALATEPGADVHGRRGEDAKAWAAHVSAVAALEPQIVVDDGADLLVALHESGAAATMLGGMEETTTGLLRLRGMELACPVLAVNEARAERSINDRFGTGQSALDG